MRMQTRLIGAALLAIAALMSNALLADEAPVETAENAVGLYDEAALSPTETLVSIHAMTMLIDILAAMQIEQMAYHPYNE